MWQKLSFLLSQHLDKLACNQCASRSASFFRSWLIRIHIVYHAVIHLQFWTLAVSHINESQLQTYESRALLFIDNYKSAILLHPEICWNKSFASQRQNYAQKMQNVQVTKSLLCVFTILHDMVDERWLLHLLKIACDGNFYILFGKITSI